jgi:hypothetical protein
MWVNGTDTKGREEGRERRATSERDLEKGEHPRERVMSRMIATRATGTPLHLRAQPMRRTMYEVGGDVSVKLWSIHAKTTGG